MSAKFLILLCLVGCIMSFEDLALAQEPLVGSPPEPLAAPFSATTVAGTVQKYLMNPAGLADGVLLSDGKQLHLPPHLSSAFVHMAKAGDKVQATVEPGLQSPYGQEFRTISLTNTKTGQVLVDQPPAFPPPPPGPGQELTVSSKVSQWLVGHGGEARGMLLLDGTEVHFPPYMQQEIVAQIKPGDAVTVQGYGTRSTIGTCLGATAITAHGKRLTVFGMTP
jgi:hypothetical protein